MHQFIIYQLSEPRKEESKTSQSSKSAKSISSSMKQLGRAIGLIECEEVVNEPVIQPGSCMIMDHDPSLPEPNRAQHEVFRNRKPVEIVQMNSEPWLAEEQNAGTRTILKERNLVTILVNPSHASPQTQSTQTLELHFNLGFDRFFLIGFPCRLMLEGAIRLHYPTLEVYYGLNTITVHGNTMIYVDNHVVDIFAKIENFEHVNNRRRLAYEFHDEVPNIALQPSAFGDALFNVSFIIYFTMNQRRRSVALFNGLLLPSPANSFKPLTVEIYPKKVVSQLEVTMVMSETHYKDQQTIVENPNSCTVDVTDDGLVHVCSLREPAFSFNEPGSSIKISGYLAMINMESTRLLFSDTSVTIKAGAARLYLDDHFAILWIDSDGTKYEVVQHGGGAMRKEFPSFSLMNLARQQSMVGGRRRSRSRTQPRVERKSVSNLNK